MNIKLANDDDDDDVNINNDHSKSRGTIVALSAQIKLPLKRACKIFIFISMIKYYYVSIILNEYHARDTRIDLVKIGEVRSFIFCRCCCCYISTMRVNHVAWNKNILFDWPESIADRYMLPYRTILVWIQLWNCISMTCSQDHMNYHFIIYFILFFCLQKHVLNKKKRIVVYILWYLWVATKKEYSLKSKAKK